MKHLTKIAIYGLTLLMGAINIHAGHPKKPYKLVYRYGPTKPQHGRLNVLYNTELSSDRLAVFDVVANNQEYEIHGCMLDIKFEPGRVKPVPVPGDTTNSSVFGNVSTAGFGGKLGRSISVMDKDGRYRMATAIQADNGDTQKKVFPAQGVLLRFAIQLIEPIFIRTMRPIVNIRNSGLVNADDKIIDNSIVYTDMGDLFIE